MVALTVGLIVLWSITPLKNLLDQEAQIRTLRTEKKKTQRANNKLRRGITSLRKDPDHIEMLARRRLGLIKTDEVAYVVIEPPAIEVKQEPPEEPSSFWEKFADKLRSLFI